jgi:hypothetical protein
MLSWWSPGRGGRNPKTLIRGVALAGFPLLADPAAEAPSAATLGLGYLREPAVAARPVEVATSTQSESRVRVHAIAALGYLGT